MSHKRLSRLIGHTLSTYRNAPERGELLAALAAFERAKAAMAHHDKASARALVAHGRAILKPADAA